MHPHYPAIFVDTSHIPLTVAKNDASVWQEKWVLHSESTGIDIDSDRISSLSLLDDVLDRWQPGVEDRPIAESEKFHNNLIVFAAETRDE
ncbi:MAG: hypothetical protein ACOC2L_03955 [Candidatus Sumerlaeota bacterium]